MTLPSRHRIRNSSPGGLRPSTLPLGHGSSPQYYFFMSERGRNMLFLWNLKARVGFEPAISDFPSRQVALTTAAEPPFGTVTIIIGICFTLLFGDILSGQRAHCKRYKLLHVWSSQSATLTWYRFNAVPAPQTLKCNNTIYRSVTTDLMRSSAMLVGGRCVWRHRVIIHIAQLKCAFYYSLLQVTFNKWTNISETFVELVIVTCTSIISLKYGLASIKICITFEHNLHNIILCKEIWSNDWGFRWLYKNVPAEINKDVTWIKWQKVNSKFGPWRSEAKHATSQLWRLLLASSE